MAIALDGFDALRRIGEHRRVFAAARMDIDKAARAIIVKCLKAKNLDFAWLCAVHDALGDDSFALITHDLKATEALALLKRLDKHFPGLKTATPAERAHHLVALARGEAEPAEPPAKAIKKISKIRAPKRVESALMMAFAKSGRQENEQDD